MVPTHIVPDDIVARLGGYSHPQPNDVKIWLNEDSDEGRQVVKLIKEVIALYISVVEPGTPIILRGVLDYRTRGWGRNTIHLEESGTDFRDAEETLLLALVVGLINELLPKVKTT